jgi:long-subunit fatty acid transport protein
MRYYDQVENRWRIKRRYVWAFWSAFGALIVGMALGAQLFH